MTPSNAIQSAVLVIIFSLGGACGWRLAAHRGTANLEQCVKERTANVLQAKKEIDHWQTDALQARDDSAQREQATRLAISSSDVALGRLRNATNQSLQSADHSLTACLERAETTGKLLDQCAEAYRDMAANADRHANDVATLKQAWPTALPETGIHWFSGATDGTHTAVR